MDLLFAPFIVLLNEEVQFGSDHIFLFDGMHALRAGLESFIAPPLVGDHLLDLALAMVRSRKAPPAAASILARDVVVSPL